MEKTIKKFLQNCSNIELTTINKQGYPETRAMLNLRNENIAPHLKGKFESFETIYFSTNKSSSKIEQIEKNKNASVYFSLPQSFQGLLLTGNAYIETDKNIKDALWHDSWKIYYKGGRDGGDYAVIRFEAFEYKFYNGNFEVIKGALKQIIL
ncbi:Uncharacterized stress protein [Elusimicrobium minutum Pei191]|uniref:Uncharacterized stress protein n=1 Tax=Elusimicrobium minutum (strain Pei191) TaxID=445932 RepID=B2KEN5_ELUMP|nr:pyridoxamine 5'-phosphate oxidase family protein [Elusimicrobium minutum]ACC98981.1 Uncharacterized stress protein [Elusimicrobium minutum Pei191]